MTLSQAKVVKFSNFLKASPHVVTCLLADLGERDRAQEILHEVVLDRCFSFTSQYQLLPDTADTGSI